ncbi:MAG: hypothetical protein NZ807_12580, partial [Dehalococcoidia bacterium]|nr:hypothetical protein [Dehalococcoidia bacterium]
MNATYAFWKRPCDNQRRDNGNTKWLGHNDRYVIAAYAASSYLRCQGTRRFGSASYVYSVKHIHLHVLAILWVQQKRRYKRVKRRRYSGAHWSCSGCLYIMFNHTAFLSV